MADERIHTALILEDDIRFEPFFKMLVERLFQEAANVKLDWDLMYVECILLCSKLFVFYLRRRWLHSEEKPSRLEVYIANVFNDQLVWNSNYVADWEQVN